MMEAAVSVAVTGGGPPIEAGSKQSPKAAPLSAKASAGVSIPSPSKANQSPVK